MKPFYKQSWFWFMLIAIINFLILLIYISVNFALDKNFWTAIGSIGTLISVIVAVCSIANSERIRKKQATYDAFSEFKKSNFDKELEINNYKIETVLQEHKRNADKKWNVVKEYLTEIERIATCVNSDVFDCETIYNMGGPFLIALYQKLKPIIDYKRKDEDRKVYYEFQKMVKELEKINLRCKNNED